MRQYLAVLDNPDRYDAAHTIRKQADDFSTWFVDSVAARLQLRAFKSCTGYR